MDVPTLQAATTIASANDAILNLLNVHPAPAKWRRSDPGSQRNDRSGGFDVKRIGNLLLSANHGDGVVIETRIGKPITEALRFVQTNDCDLVIVGEPKPVGNEPRQVSPGLMELVHNCPVPVWIIRPARSGSSKVLSMVDLDSSDPKRGALNTLAIELGTSAAGGPKKLLLGHMCNLANRSAHESLLLDLASQHGIREQNTHQVSGTHGDVISQFIRKLDVGLVVAGVASQTHAGKFLTGDAVERLLRTTSSSLLALKLYRSQQP